mmetsp:Transcript_56226/g.176577  ORF Transcript_56226/g.176577 Transcript_56226/m.176577 type:complete len:216 (-) Transcript_56226:16-663(-)
MRAIGGQEVKYDSAALIPEVARTHAQRPQALQAPRGGDEAADALAVRALVGEVQRLQRAARLTQEVRHQEQTRGAEVASGQVQVAQARQLRAAAVLQQQGQRPQLEVAKRPPARGPHGEAIAAELQADERIGGGLHLHGSAVLEVLVKHRGIPIPGQRLHRPQLRRAETLDVGHSLHSLACGRPAGPRQQRQGGHLRHRPHGGHHGGPAAIHGKA